MIKDICAWLRRQRVCNRRLATLGRVCTDDTDVLGSVWLSSHYLSGLSVIFQLTGGTLALSWLLHVCLQFPTLGYWWSASVGVGYWVLFYLVFPRHASGLWVIGLTSFNLAALVFVVDFAVASLRTPQQITAPVINRYCYNPVRGRSFHTPKRRCDVEIQVGWYTHLIDVTNTGQGMGGAILVLRRGFLGVDYPRLSREVEK